MRQKSHLHVSRGLVTLALVFLSVSSGPGRATVIAAEPVQAPRPEDSIAARTVIGMIEGEHLLKRQVDDDLASRVLDDYLESCDYLKLNFTRADVAEFRAARAGLAAKLKAGDLTLPFQIYRRLQQRQQERQALRKELLAPGSKLDFGPDEFLISNPEALDYPGDDREVRERWRKQLGYELLRINAGLSGPSLSPEAARAKLLKSYESRTRNILQNGPDQVLETFLQTLLAGIDRGSSYMSARTWKEFETSFRGNLIGIGAQLKEDGGVFLTSIVPGGPADKDGRLKAGDRFVSVGQGVGGELIDVDALTLSQVVGMIRGAEGTVVRVGVMPAGETELRVFALRRSRIVTEDARVRDRIFTQGTKADGTPCKVGYLYVPTLYQQGENLARTSTNDVRQKLGEFASSGVDVVLLDLRSNSGGVLNEAITLAGLFLDGGTILQVRQAGGVVSKYNDTSPGMAWEKPLVVLTSRSTSSGAEIICAAVQDHNRGLLVGDDSTYGSGTVQNLLNLKEKIGDPNLPDLGTFKMTTSQFFRPNGESPQYHGVLADLVLPSRSGARQKEAPPAGAVALFDRLPPASPRNYGMLTPEHIQTLRSQAQARYRAQPEFVRLSAELEKQQFRSRQLLIPLNEAKFLAYVKEGESSLPPEPRPGEPDFYLNEVLAVTADYVRLLAGKTAAPPVNMTAIAPQPASAPAPPPAPAPVVVPGALPLVAPVIDERANRAQARQNVELQILEVERAIQRNTDEIARYAKEEADWDGVIRQGNQAMREAQSTGRQFVVGFAGGFAISKKAEAERNRRQAEGSLNFNRDRMLQLRQELLRLGNERQARASVLGN